MPDKNKWLLTLEETEECYIVDKGMGVVVWEETTSAVAKKQLRKALSLLPGMTDQDFRKLQEECE